MRTFGHAECGVYGEVVAAGQVAVGDAITQSVEG
jgi:MOSC domain-containing protein YiiM